MTRTKRRLLQLEANLDATIVTVYHGSEIIKGPMTLFDLMLYIKYGGDSWLIGGETPLGSDVRIELLQRLKN